MAGMSFLYKLFGRALMLLALFCAAASADQDPVRNQVSFSVERSREVENDWVTATIGATHESTDPAEVAAKINEAVSWAMQQAKATRGVRVRTGAYTTRPISDPKRSMLRRWRGTQTLVLEAADAQLVSELVGRLQTRLQLQDIGFSVSPERRRAVEDELLDEALAAFRDRAERVRKQLGAKGYAIATIQLGSSGGQPPRPMRGAVMMAESVAPPPPLEAGTSTLRATAHATIELGF